MSIRAVLSKPFFSSRFKLQMHLLQVLLVSTAVGLSVPRLFIKNAPRGRVGTIALGMVRYSIDILHALPSQLISAPSPLPSTTYPRVPHTRPKHGIHTDLAKQGAKSLIILTYLLLSDYAPAFRRWHSYKAHLILAALEVLFWSGVAGLMFQANMKACTGITCTLSWIVVGVAVVVM